MILWVILLSWNSKILRITCQCDSLYVFVCVCSQTRYEPRNLAYQMTFGFTSCLVLPRWWQENDKLEVGASRRRIA